MKRKVHTVQIDEAGHQRIEQLAAYYGLTQAGAASLVVGAAADEHIRTRIKSLAEKQPESGGEVTGVSSEAGEVVAADRVT